MNKVLDEKFNEKTIAAINEAKSGKNPNKFMMILMNSFRI